MQHPAGEPVSDHPVRSQKAERGRTRRLGAAAALAACAAGLMIGLVACGDERSADEGRRGAPVLVDEVAGSYRGATIDDGPAELQAALGGQAPAGENEPGAALGWDSRNDYGPPLIRFGGNSSESWYRYRDAVFFLRNDKVGVFIVVDDAARSLRGVGVGMHLDEARAAYPELECGTANEDSEYEPFPACTGLVADDRWVWFGGDPIRSITVAKIPLEGL